MPPIYPLPRAMVVRGVSGEEVKSLSMLGESEKRAADLAMSRFGVSSQRLQQTIKSLRANGQRLDLLNALVRRPDC